MEEGQALYTSACKHTDAQNSQELRVAEATRRDGVECAVLRVYSGASGGAQEICWYVSERVHACLRSCIRSMRAMCESPCIDEAWEKQNLARQLARALADASLRDLSAYTSARVVSARFV